MIDLNAVGAALKPTREGLEAAGFTLSLAESAGRVQLVVVAGPEACEDCLVPKPLFRQMANDEILEAGIGPVDLDIVYPIDSRRS